MIAKMQRGIRENTDAIVIKLVQTVYIVGAIPLGVLKAISTNKNLPKPPTGCSMAATRPPTSFPLSKPSFQDGTKGAATVKAAPRK